MKKYQYANGYDFEKTMEVIRSRNNNTKCFNEFEKFCVYKDSNEGNHCIIACFIPDNHVTLTNNEATLDEDGWFLDVIGLIRKYPELKDSMPLDNIDALKEFQKIHDDYEPDFEISLHRTIELWLRDKIN